MAQPKQAASVQDDIENAQARSMGCAVCDKPAQRLSSADSAGMKIQRLECASGHAFTRIWPVH